MTESSDCGLHVVSVFREFYKTVQTLLQANYSAYFLSQHRVEHLLSLLNTFEKSWKPFNHSQQWKISQFMKVDGLFVKHATCIIWLATLFLLCELITYTLKTTYSSAGENCIKCLIGLINARYFSLTTLDTLAWFYGGKFQTIQLFLYKIYIM